MTDQQEDIDRKSVPLVWMEPPVIPAEILALCDELNRIERDLIKLIAYYSTLV